MKWYEKAGKVFGSQGADALRLACGAYIVCWIVKSVFSL